MREASLVLAILLAGMLGASCHRLIPATRPPFTITGLVEAVDANTLNLRHKSGQRITIAITPRTAIVRRDNPAKIADVKIGMRIVVLYHVVDGAATADEVHLFRRPSRDSSVDGVSFADDRDRRPGGDERGDSRSNPGHPVAVPREASRGTPPLCSQSCPRAPGGSIAGDDVEGRARRSGAQTRLFRAW